MPGAHYVPGTVLNVLHTLMPGVNSHAVNCQYPPTQKGGEGVCGLAEDEPAVLSGGFET